MSGGKMREYTYKWKPEEYTEDGIDPILKITKSSFNCYQWCPTKYEFQYRQRLPIDVTEPMLKGTVVHNVRQDFFDAYDIKKAENLSHSELITYHMGLHPIDEHGDIYMNMATFEANRFLEAKANDNLDSFLPVINEVMLDAEITIAHDTNPKCIHLQGIIDRMFLDDGKYIPIELKTGLWKDWRTTSMRKELAFYKLLVDNASQESLDSAGIDGDIPLSHWGWYYPVSNYIQVEPVKKQSMNALIRGITLMIKSYEDNEFTAKYYFKTCQTCSFYSLCEVAQEAQWL